MKAEDRAVYERRIAELDAHVCGRLCPPYCARYARSGAANLRGFLAWLDAGGSPAP